MSRLKTKLVLRHFPPTFTSSELDSLFSSISLFPLIDFHYFSPGKQRTPSELTRHGTAYVNVVRAVSIPTVLSLLAAPIPWREADGQAASITVQVEYAPYQRAHVAHTRKKRKDRIDGTIEQDEDYQAFVAAFTAPAGEHKAPATTAVTAAAAEGKGSKVVHRTPLVDFLVKEHGKGDKDREGRKGQRGGAGPEGAKVRAGVSYAGAVGKAGKDEGVVRAVTKADERRAEAEKRRQRKLKERTKPGTGSKRQSSRTEDGGGEEEAKAGERGRGAGRARGRGKGRQRERRGGKGSEAATPSSGAMSDAGPVSIPTPPLGNAAIIIATRPTPSGPSYASALTGSSAPPPAPAAAPVSGGVEPTQRTVAGGDAGQSSGDRGGGKGGRTGRGRRGKGGASGADRHAGDGAAPEGQAAGGGSDAGRGGGKQRRNRGGGKGGRGGGGSGSQHAALGGG